MGGVQSEGPERSGAPYSPESTNKKKYGNSIIWLGGSFDYYQKGKQRVYYTYNILKKVCKKLDMNVQRITAHYSDSIDTLNSVSKTSRKWLICEIQKNVKKIGNEKKIDYEIRLKYHEQWTKHKRKRNPR